MPYTDGKQSNKFICDHLTLVNGSHPKAPTCRVGVSMIVVEKSRQKQLVTGISGSKC